MAQTALLERITNSAHHTSDAAMADFFLVPLWQQCLSGSGSGVGPYARWALRYLSTTWPYW
eukprot:1189564-Prorocentrum_minimum.AAC.7